jgi:hypothetical protein
MPYMENPDRLAQFIHVEKNTIGAPAFTEKQTANFPLCFLSLSG